MPLSRPTPVVLEEAHAYARQAEFDARQHGSARTDLIADTLQALHPGTEAILAEQLGVSKVAAESLSGSPADWIEIAMIRLSIGRALDQTLVTPMEPPKHLRPLTNEPSHFFFPGSWTFGDIAEMAKADSSANLSEATLGRLSHQGGVLLLGGFRGPEEQVVSMGAFELQCGSAQQYLIHELATHPYAPRELTGELLEAWLRMFGAMKHVAIGLAETRRNVNRALLSNGFDEINRIPDHFRIGNDYVDAVHLGWGPRPPYRKPEWRPIRERDD